MRVVPEHPLDAVKVVPLGLVRDAVVVHDLDAAELLQFKMYSISGHNNGS